MIGKLQRSWDRAILPLSVFLAVGAAHFTYLGLFPEGGPESACGGGACSCEEATWLGHYVDSQSYWLGYSYAASLAFAATAFRRYRELRLSAARNAAVGGVTASGVLAVAGCYLLGCCGSPMLPVYLSLFGAAFLKFAKPLVAVVTTLALLGAWWWVRRRERLAAPPATSGNPGPTCCPSCCATSDDTPRADRD